jgi:2-iminobutanoate/2-iminopropanoate deaminase
MTDIRPVRPEGWTSLAPYSPVVVAGDTVYVSGQVPIDPRTGETVGDDIATQTRRTLANVVEALAAVGCERDRIVKLNVYLTDIAEFPAMNEVYRAFFDEYLPARSTVEVSALGRPDFRIEIDAVAAL